MRVKSPLWEEEYSTLLLSLLPDKDMARCCYSTDQEGASSRTVPRQHIHHGHVASGTMKDKCLLLNSVCSSLNILTLMLINFIFTKFKFKI
jgi:hypothetical protein